MGIMTDYSSYLYAYSTIAQSLAALGGVLTAVIVFRNERWSNRKEEYERYARTVTDPTQQNGAYYIVYDSQEKLNDDQFRATFALVATGITLAACFVLIPLTRVDVMGSWWAVFWMVVTVILGLITLGFYGWVLREITIYPNRPHGGYILFDRTLAKTKELQRSPRNGWWIVPVKYRWRQYFLVRHEKEGPIQVFNTDSDALAFIDKSIQSREINKSPFTGAQK